MILAHTNLPNVVCGLDLAAHRSKALGLEPVGRPREQRRFSAGLFRRALLATPLVITEAIHARDWLAEEWGVDPARIHVIRGRRAAVAAP